MSSDGNCKRWARGVVRLQSPRDLLVSCEIKKGFRALGSVPFDTVVFHTDVLTGSLRFAPLARRQFQLSLRRGVTIRRCDTVLRYAVAMLDASTQLFLLRRL